MIGRFRSARMQAYADMRGVERDHKLVVTGKVWVPGKTPPQKRVFKGGQREHLVVRVTETLSEWQTSPFQNEGACRAGARSAMCMDGVPWHQADAEAATLVAEGLTRMHARRPSWDEGQREYSEPRETCAWCGGGVPDDLLVGNHRTRFCSGVCARSAMQHRELAQTRHEGAAYAAAMDIIVRARNPAIACAECDKKFRPTKPGQKFCSHACSVKADTLPDRPCAHCSTMFHPKLATTVYCSQACVGLSQRTAQERACEECGTVFRRASGSKQAARFCSKVCTDKAKTRHSEPKICTFCGTPFVARSGKAKFCCTACAVADSRLGQGWVPKRATPHIFDHYLTMPVNATRPAWLTAERFDELLAA